jgi:hypothetical protein
VRGVWRQRIRALRLRRMAVLELRRTRRRGIRGSAGLRREGRLVEADDIQRLELLVKAFEWHRTEHEETR